MKRFRDESGRLVISTDEIAQLTLAEANAYYLDGEQYVTEGRTYTCHRYIAKDARERNVEMIQFISDAGYNLFCDPARMGTFLPDVASDGLEIVRVPLQPSEGAGVEPPLYIGLLRALEERYEWREKALAMVDGIIPMEHSARFRIVPHIYKGSDTYHEWLGETRALLDAIELVKSHLQPETRSVCHDHSPANS